MQLLIADSPAATADYRRQARRIRASFDRDPFLRQQALSQLAQRRNAQMQVQAIHREVVARHKGVVKTRAVDSALINSINSTVEQDFSDHALSCLQPFGFTFSDRVRLLDSAEKLGITRFRANMLLALQEHQAPARQFAAPEVPARSIAPSLVVIVGLELLVVAILLALFAL